MTDTKKLVEPKIETMTNQMKDDDKNNKKMYILSFNEKENIISYKKENKGKKMFYYNIETLSQEYSHINFNMNVIIRCYNIYSLLELEIVSLIDTLVKAYKCIDVRILSKCEIYCDIKTDFLICPIYKKSI